MSIEHLAPTLKHVGPVDALKARLEAATAWRRSVGAVDHAGCGVVLIHDAIRLDIDLLCESRLSRYQPPTNSQPRA
jgi:hypothetical protein